MDYKDCVDEFLSLVCMLDIQFQPFSIPSLFQCVSHDWDMISDLGYYQQIEEWRYKHGGVQKCGYHPNHPF